MAKRLDVFDFNARRPNYASYPLEEWFDGSIWELDRQTDFPGQKTVHGFRSYIQYAARRYPGLKLRTAVPDHKTVVIQAYQVEETKAELDDGDF